MSAENRKQQILAKSAELFATYGYEGTRIWQIARACEISDGAVLHFFKDKKTLYMQTFINTITKQMPVNARTGKDREVRLVNIAENILETCRRDPSSMRLLLQIFLSDPEQSGFYYHSIMKKDFLAGVEDLINQGIGEGEYRSTDTHLTAICFLGTIVYLAMCHEFFGADSLDGKSPSELAELSVGFFLNGVRCRN
jgi:AcrR family transcriptional regulator